LVGEWLFDTNASPTPDTSGSGNNGTLSATPPSWQQTGGYNSKGAYSFNGSTNYIDIGSSGSLGLTNELTLTVWVKFDNVSDATRLGNIIGNYPASANFNLEGHFLGKVRFFWSGAPDLFGTKDLRGSWHHVAVVRNATANKTIIYIDGVFDKQDVSGVNRDIQWPLRIGGDFRGEPGLPFQGLIDNIRIYSSALSSSDIQKLYAEEKASHEVAVK
jgi:MSHA biogenesis protein MshQ